MQLPARRRRYNNIRRKPEESVHVLLLYYTVLLCCATLVNHSGGDREEKKKKKVPMNRASKEADLFELRGSLLCRPHGAPIPRREDPYCRPLNTIQLRVVLHVFICVTYMSCSLSCNIIYTYLYRVFKKFGN